MAPNLSTDEDVSVSIRMADEVLVRFPPGLGIVPPRDVPHPPRTRAGLG